MKRKNEYDGLIESFDKYDTNESEDNVLNYINGETDPKAEKMESFLKTPATIGIIALLAAEFIMLLVLWIVAGSEKIVYEGSIGLRQILSSSAIGSVGDYETLVSEGENLSEAESFLQNYVADESSALAMLSPSFVSFVQHDYNIKNQKGIAVNKANGGLGVLPENPNDFATAVPSEAPSETASAEATAAPSLNTKYYQFNLENNGYHSSLYNLGGAVTTGIGTDNCEIPLNVTGEKNGGLGYGTLSIQNPYGTPAFDLKEVLQSPLAIPEKGGQGSPTVMLYYTHTSEGYAIKESDRSLSAVKSLKTYDESKNVVGCGNIIAEKLTKRGVGVINRKDKNDENYDDAYTLSNALAKNVADVTPTLDLSIDIHVNALEYPSGTRYAPVAQKDGTSYAKILFVITEGDKNPNWRENIKLAMLLNEKLQEKVPGISLGISLRNDAKYNSKATDKGLLIELGFEGNLVSEAQATAKIFGEVLGEIYG